MPSPFINNLAKSFASMRQRCGMSLKARLIVMTVGLFVLFIWTLVFVSVTVLQTQLEQVLSDQQYASVQRLAADLDNKLQDRVQSLVKVAETVSTDLSAATLDAYLARFGGLHIIFTGGIAIIGMDGVAIADYPDVPGRHGTYFGDRDYFRQVVAMQAPYIDKPILGRALKRPVLTIAVPVFDHGGKLRAVMTGITDLTAPNFLGPVSAPEMAGKGEFFVFSPRDNLIVAATNATHMMAAAPARGRNLMYDRFVDGFEGSGVASSSEGISKLYSAKAIPAAHWIIMAALPTDVAFAPVKVMRNYLFAAAAFLSLLAVVLIQWMARRMLIPLDDAALAMRRMTRGQMALAPLPVIRKDEIGQLIGNFNLLVDDRRRYETALQESEQRLRKQEEEFRALVENLPDVVCRFDRNTWCVYANPAMEKATGLPYDQIIGRSCEQMGLSPDAVFKWTESIKKVFVTQLADTFEFSLPAPIGDRYYQARLVPEFGPYGQVMNVLAVARDISVIKGGEAVLRESEQRLHGITANMPGMVFQCLLRARDGALLFTYVSEGVVPLLGLTPGQAQANRNTIPDLIIERDRVAFNVSLRDSAQSMDVWNWEGCVLTAAGDEKWVNCRATPRIAGDGDVIWEGVMLNITNSKHSEEEIRESRQLLRELAAHLENVREEERKRIAREVHDELGQALTVLRMDVSLLRLNFGGQSPQLMERIQSMKETVDGTIQIVRHVTSSLRPAALDLGLTAAIEWLAEEFTGRNGINCLVKTDGSEVILEDIRATALFRIVQESLTNVVKHANASEVEVSILAKEDHLWLEVRDNGKGFAADCAKKTGSFGLIGMRERALMIGGKVEIHSVVGSGTRVSVCIPFVS